MTVPNLLLIAGTGNKSGKTTLACRIIGQFRKEGVLGIKITPHFHETTPGLALLSESGGFSIYEETDAETGKDTSRMLKAGAERVFFAKVTDNDLLSAFEAILQQIPENVPIVCESPALRYFTEPGLFIIMDSPDSHNKKNINRLEKLPHVCFNLEEVQSMKEIPVQFHSGRWVCELVPPENPPLRGVGEGVSSVNIPLPPSKRDKQQLS